MMREIGALLAPLGIQEIGPGGGGADIGPIAQAGKVPMLAYQGDSTRYFTIHHTPADTVDRIAPEEVSKAAAALAVVTYVVADAAGKASRADARQLSVISFQFQEAMLAWSLRSLPAMPLGNSSN